ncbi:DUF3341 domain-containing protein [Gimesia chilikensis]|uniref:DUF3341 domain-containing protein n=1 Tax=Gimesia chilikensis TaxID=2605989 RepID=UPI0011EFA91E|nr:DUF3341 domain-containing protein [Gimesia chilikensis]KAA0131555.1 DUF3341 domain-containing protein [Gimesia chilikensis]
MTPPEHNEQKRTVNVSTQIQHDAGQLFGLLAQFPSEQELIAATQNFSESGYRSLDAFSPFPLEELSEALQLKRSRVAPIVFAGGLIGGVSIYALEYWINLFAYPLNVGGRPLHSWISFIPPTFECTVLLGSLAGACGMLWLCGLPRLNHPVFEVDAFQRASTDGWFLCIQAEDDHFDPQISRQLLFSCGAREVWDVPEIKY